MKPNNTEKRFPKFDEQIAVVGPVGLDEVIIPDMGESVNDKNWADVRVCVGYFGATLATGLAGAGLSVRLFTVVGDDPVGVQLLETLKTNGIEVSACRFSGRSTVNSHIVIHHDQRQVLRTRRSVLDVWAEELLQWSDIFRRTYRWIALGPLEGDWDGAFSRRVIDQANLRGIPISWTPGEMQVKLGVSFFKQQISKIRLIVMNREEACRFCYLPQETSVCDAALTLAASTDSKALVIVTNHGKSPAIAYDGSTKYIAHFRSILHVIDDSSAGDTLHMEAIRQILQGTPTPELLFSAVEKAIGACAVWGNGVQLSNRRSTAWNNVSWAEQVV